MTGTATLTRTLTHSTVKRAKPRLFCFSVMMPSGGEHDLIAQQLGHGLSLFACDSQSLFSSKRLRLENNGKIFHTEDIGPMKCDFGGPYGLALNSEIFIRVWKRVFSDGHYLSATLTVKIDPDAVFLPGRLQTLLLGADADDNVYFNNCDHGLHGPVEIMTRAGVETFAKGITRCEKALAEEFSWGGEDVFLRHCLGLLGVFRVDNFKLLSEDHCFDEDPVHVGCNSGKVSFHPFKEVDRYMKCLAEAEAEG